MNDAYILATTILSNAIHDVAEARKRGGRKLSLAGHHDSLRSVLMDIQRMQEQIKELSKWQPAEHLVYRDGRVSLEIQGNLIRISGEVLGYGIELPDHIRVFQKATSEDPQP